MFIGRKAELGILEQLEARQQAALVVMTGRRRIGKSRLVQEFAKDATVFLEFQGLAPRAGIGKAEQLRAFSEQLARQMGFPVLALKNWSAAFTLLAKALARKRTVVLLDEISWMAVGERDFAGELKIAWDTQFKKYPYLTMVLCGSVSSWIEHNILNSTGFVGRLALELKLEELPIEHLSAFWRKRASRISSREKLKMLCVTGGVPRYLEEIRPHLSTEENLRSLCFQKEGLLFREFETIFQDIFSKKASRYQKIVKSLVKGAKTLSAISQSLKKERSGNLSEALQDLMESGFVAEDKSYRPGSQKASRSSHYRLKDNYLRFYLKYLEPRKARIEKGLMGKINLEELPEWESIFGLQFENLVLNNLPKLLKALKLAPTSVLSASPYFQKKTRDQPGVQVDLLIQTKHSLYLGEIKFRRSLGTEIVAELKQKIAKLDCPQDKTRRPFLVYSGELKLSESDREFFDALINVEDWLE